MQSMLQTLEGLFDAPESTDADATVSSFTYWPRGWLKSIAVTPAVASGVKAQVTNYVYFNSGDLHTITAPDGAVATFSNYDSAHHLLDANDSAGNAVHYDRDSLGNVTHQTLKDPQGKFAQTLTRNFDDLGRQQSYQVNANAQ